jgi:4-amino-4-deoxy-L-arabinose transferase-like glycosyltransferase
MMTARRVSAPIIGEDNQPGCDAAVSHDRDVSRRDYALRLAQCAPDPRLQRCELKLVVLRRAPPLALILVIGALVRLALWTWFQDERLHIGDELDYNAIATNLVQRGEFALVPGAPTSLRPPLYPAAVAGVYWLFGLENLQAVRLLQAGVSLLNVLLLYRLGSEVFCRRVGLWASGFYCFYPSLLGFNNLLLTEALFTLLLSGACLFMARSLRRASIIYLALAAVVLGLAALTRSVLWPFPVALSVLLFGAWKGDLRQRGLAVGVLAALFTVTIGPWVVRNTALEKTFVAIDTLGGRNFMQGNYRFTPMYRSWDAVSLSGEQNWYDELAAVYSSSDMATQGQVDRLALRQGIRFVLDNPELTLQRDIVKFFRFWGLERELIAGAAHGYFGDIPGPIILVLTLLIFGSYTSGLISGVFGFILAPPSDRRIHWLLFVVGAFICAVHTLTFGHSRYHLPIMPLVLLYSTSALVHRRNIWQRRHEPAFRVAFAVSGVFFLGWLWEIVVVDAETYWKMLGSA